VESVGLRRPACACENRYVFLICCSAMSLSGNIRRTSCPKSLLCLYGDRLDAQRIVTFRFAQQFQLWGFGMIPLSSGLRVLFWRC
jgi:hypothetical protein